MVRPRQLRLLEKASLQQEPWALDELMRTRGFSPLAGVDEAGRGPLAGPVVAAAVMLPPGTRLKGLRDSKLLSPSQRELLYQEILKVAICWGVGVVEAQEIDRINIAEATRRAMEEAVSRLDVQPKMVLVDGIMGIRHPTLQMTLIKGDQRSHCVSAASVVAKVTRDRLMAVYHEQYPHYNFRKHKGYATKEHLAAIRNHGMCPIHRRTFHSRSLLQTNGARNGS